jgi:hypothetical protein
MPTLTLSLDLYIEEQELSGDNKYHTDYYGHQDARKGTSKPIKVYESQNYLLC